MCSLSAIADVNRTILSLSSASNRRWLYTCRAVFYLFFLGFGRVKVFFRDEEHNLGFGVLRIGGTLLWFMLSSKDFELVQMRPILR